MMGRESRCNGHRIGAEEYSTKANKFFEDLLPNARISFEEINPKDFSSEVALGDRYKDDWCVYQSLISSASERQFLSEPMAWLHDALQDCAGKDFWYSHSKQWEDQSSILESEGIEFPPLPDIVISSEANQ